MTLQQLNEYWMQDVSKSMEKKGTKGEFTEHCKKKGYTKASYDCIKDTIKDSDKVMDDPDIDHNSKKYKDAARWKKKAVLARTFKKIAKDNKKD